MSRNMSYARAVDACPEGLPQVFEAVDLSNWVPCRDIAKSAGIATDCLVADMDFLDSVFIDFHRELRQHMLDKYGLMGRSEAYDLHAAILPCLSVLDGYDSEASDA